MRKILAFNLLIFILVPMAHVAALETQQPASKDIPGTLENIRDYIFTFFIVVAVIFFVIAGYLFVTSAGDSSKYDTAKKALLFGVIGTLVAVLSQGIVDFIQGTLTK